MVTLVGVVTAVTCDKVGAVLSIANVFTLNALLAFPAESVTVTVQFEKVLSLSVLNEIELVPLLAEVVPEEQEPPYDIVPASFDENA